MKPQVTGQLPMEHFATFARLHDARPADAAALRVLSEHLPAARGGERPAWPLLMEALGAHVLVATECHVLVGAVVVWHRKDTAEARLAWLGVAPTACGRGVGSLLLKTAIGTAAAHRAEAMTVRPPADGALLARFLLDAGFVPEKGGSMRLDLGKIVP